MMENPDFQTMTLLFRRLNSLPPLPAVVLKLIRQIDEGEASAASLEQTICSDPALAVNFLRLSTFESSERTGQLGTSVRSMILLIGQRSVRRIAVSLLLLNSLCHTEASPWFDRQACAQHCIFVARLAKCVLKRKQFDPNAALGWGDAFAAGILHELPLWTLAKTSPSSFNRIFLYAQRHSITLNDAFRTLYGTPLSKLGAIAVQAWGIPHEYNEYFNYADEPWFADTSYDLIASIVYADLVSQRTEFKLETWEVDVRIPLEVEEAVGLPPEELDLLIEKIRAVLQAPGGELKAPSKPILL